MRKSQIKVEIGQTYGQLTVLAWAGVSTRGQIKQYWKVSCACGSVTRKRTDQLKIGRCSDCGRIEQAKSMLGKNKGENHPRYIKDRVEYSIRKKTKAIIKSSKFRMHLTEDEIYKLISEPCHYCGTLSDLTDAEGGKWPKGVNGLDRIDSSKEYTTDNTVSCCKKCNYMKNVWTVQEFLDHVEKIYRKNRQG